MVLSRACWQATNLISFINAVVVPPLIALIVSGIVVALLTRGRIAALMLDHPNARSLHATPKPRVGGIGIVAGVAAAWVYSMGAIDAWVVSALVLLVAVSLV